MSDKNFEITHDSLAVKIWEKVSAEEKGLMDIRNLITSAYNTYKARKVLLAKEDIAYIAPFKSRLHLDGDEQVFIEKSEKFYRNQRIALFTTRTLIIVILVIGIVSINIEERAAQKNNAELNIANDNINKTNNRLKNEQDAKDKALQARNEALVRIQNDSTKLRKALFDAEKQASIAKRKTRLAEMSKKEADLAKEVADNMSKKANAATEATAKNLKETRATLDITKLLLIDPTASLTKALQNYDSVQDKYLKQIIRQDAYDAFNNTLYQYNYRWTNPITDIATSDDMKHIMFADGSRYPNIWVPGENFSRRLLGHSGKVTSIASYLGKNSKGFITVEDNKEAILWSETGKYISTKTFLKPVSKIISIPNSDELLLVYNVKGLGVISISESGDSTISNDFIKDVVTTPVGSSYKFISLSNDDIVTFWDQKGKSYISSIEKQLSKGIETISKIAISPDGAYLAAISGTNLSFFKITTSGKSSLSLIPEPELTLPLPFIRQAAFNNNKQMIVTTSNGACYEYNYLVQELKELKGYSSNTDIKFLNIARQRDEFATASTEGTIKIWNSNMTAPIVFSSGINYDERETNNSDRSYENGSLKASYDSAKKIFSIKSPKLPEVIYFSTAKMPVNGYWQGDTVDNIKLLPVTKVISGLPITTSLNLSIDTLENTYETFVRTDESRLNILWSGVSASERFVLVRLKSPGLRKIYYKLYPTFFGIKDFMNLK